MDPVKILHSAQKNWSSKPIFTTFYGDEEAIISVYTVTHFIIGMIFAWLQIPLWILIVLHIIFEIIENSDFVIKGFRSLSIKIRTAVGVEPWTPYTGDSIANSVADTFAAVFGWILVTEVRKEFFVS